MTHLRALSVPFKIVKTCQIPTFGHLLFCLTISNPKINVGYAKQRADEKKVVSDHLFLVLGDFLKRMCGLTEAFLWIQLVAEGSPSNRRALGVVITKARYNNVEGSTFKLNQRKGSVKSKDSGRTFKEKCLHVQRRMPVKLKCFGLIVK